MSEQIGSLLGLPPLGEEIDLNPMGNALAVPEDESTHREVVNINDQNIIYKVTVDAKANRACGCMDATGKVYQYASKMFDEISSTLTSITDSAKDSPHGAYVADFNKYLNQVAAQQMLGLARMGAAQIAQEQVKTIPPPMLKEKPRGFLTSLFSRII